MKRGSSRAGVARRARSAARSLVFVAALCSHGCSKTPAASTAPTPPQAPTAVVAQPRAVLGFQGHIALDPRAGYANKEGDVWQYLFYQNGTLFDAMLCYPHFNRCELVDLGPSGLPQRWTATLSESVPGIRPFVLQYELPAGHDWKSAENVTLRVESPGLGETGSTSLTSIKQPSPPRGLRELLRGEQRLRSLYAQIAQRYAELPAGQRVFPESHAEYPPSPPCHPTVVSDPSSLSWLGLTPPAVLSWSFEVKADEAQGSVRLIARRDADCEGHIETLTLNAKLDAFGDFAREPIEIGPRASAP